MEIFDGGVGLIQEAEETWKTELHIRRELYTKSVEMWYQKVSTQSEGHFDP